MTTWLVVGLGNPGDRYARTRHNVGQMVVDELASRAGTKLTSHKANAQVAQVRFTMGGDKVVLAKPNTFMNTSGGPVANLAKYFRVSPEHIVVLHDELDIDFDTLKLKIGGGHGGHNGLRDIAKAIDTQNYNRVRIGIGRPPSKQDPADFVLSEFSAAERANLPVLISDAADAVELIIREGLLAAQNSVHTVKGEPS